MSDFPQIQRGVGGRVTGGVSGRVFRWMVGQQQDTPEISGYGDGQQKRFSTARRGFSFSVNGHAEGTSSILPTGTVYMELYGSGTVVKYRGDAVYTNLMEDSDRTSGRSVFSFRGRFNGDPTV